MIGQCWTSEAEPELGIGFVREQDAQSVLIEFPAAPETRRYNKRTAPLRRLEFKTGETVRSVGGKKLVIDRAEVRKDLLYYIEDKGQGEGKLQFELCESDLSPLFKIQRPLDRFLAGHWDPLRSYSIRKRTFDLWRRQMRSPARGMIGPRARFFPHQLYVAHQISSRGLPRALLADEVGLGKTIEAGWILHRLLVTGRIRRVLVIAPEALINQWFIELFRRFNLSFWVPDSQSLDKVQTSDFADQARVIISLESLTKLQSEGSFDETQWDMIVVDEAHRVGWKPGEASGEYQILEALAQRSRGLLLLTATPEQLGLEGHFARLRLIDPVRFASFEDYVEEHRRYQEVVQLTDALLSGRPLKVDERKSLEEKLKGKIALEELVTPVKRSVLLALIDHYGTGRVYFRNSRKVVEIEHCTFPKRRLQTHQLVSRSGDRAGHALVRWLAEFAKTHREEKTLLICSSAAQVTDWEKRLREDHALKVVAFHENLPLLARDRNAAHFEDPQGATLLLSSEIGGEGRNFQHASQLILADLPADPDVLEQRIGRLDRIGQGSDITIHVPYLAGKNEELLLRWHQEVFQAFENPPQGTAAVHEKYKEELHEILDGESSTRIARFDSLLTRAKADHLEILREIETGRDRLIEINSFDPEEGVRLFEELTTAERADELREYLEEVLDTLGVHSEDLDPDSIFVEPGDSMFVSYFPALPPDGIRMTFSRKKSLSRNDLSLMTWDHPMVTETMESIANQELGNVSVAAWKKPLLLIQCSFILEPSAVDSAWFADQFFPAEAINVVLDATGLDLTETWSWEKLKAELSLLSGAGAQLARQIPGGRLRGLIGKAHELAETKSRILRKEALQQLQSFVGMELSRLESLKRKNQLVSDHEIQWWSDRKKTLEKAFEESSLRLDSLLVILPQH